MENLINYDGIRPYNDNEVNAIINSMLEEVEFMVFLRYLFPSANKKKMIEKLSKIDNVKDFQMFFAQPALQVILDRSVDSLTFSGLHLIGNDTCLFISNHRDIALDPSFLSLIMFRNHYDTCQIAIGSNLLISPLVTNMLKLNKSFIVHRNVSPRQLYLYSKQLSSYIFDLVSNKKSSAWIAQREGRSKDGNDHTQHGLIKMLTMNKEDNPQEIIKKLNIVPVAISYEYEPCDLGKAEETYCLNNDILYFKTPEQDLNNLLSGMKDYKGRVHISICKPLNKTIDMVPEFADQNSDYATIVSDMIDKEIYENYKLWPTNYIAFDLITGMDEYSTEYSSEQKQLFLEHIEKQLQKTKQNKQGIKEVLLNIYANPVKNSLKNLNP